MPRREAGRQASGARARRLREMNREGEGLGGGGLNSRIGSDGQEHARRSIRRDPAVSGGRIDPAHEACGSAFRAGSAILANRALTHADRRRSAACRAVAGLGAGDNAAAALRHVPISNDCRFRSSIPLKPKSASRTDLVFRAQLWLEPEGCVAGLSVVRHRHLTPRNRSESTCYHADRRPICGLNNNTTSCQHFSCFCSS